MPPVFTTSLLVSYLRKCASAEIQHISDDLNTLNQIISQMLSLVQRDGDESGNVRVFKMQRLGREMVWVILPVQKSNGFRYDFSELYRWYQLTPQVIAQLTELVAERDFLPELLYDATTTFCLTEWSTALATVLGHEKTTVTAKDALFAPIPSSLVAAAVAPVIDYGYLAFALQHLPEYAKRPRLLPVDYTLYMLRLHAPEGFTAAQARVKLIELDVASPLRFTSPEGAGQFFRRAFAEQSRNPEPFCNGLRLERKRKANSWVWKVL